MVGAAAGLLIGLGINDSAYNGPPCSFCGIPKSPVAHSYTSFKDSGYVTLKLFFTTNLHEPKYVTHVKKQTHIRNPNPSLIFPLDREEWRRIDKNPTQYNRFNPFSSEDTVMKSSN